MADWNTHLAIAKRYMEKHPGEIVDEGAFYQGSLAPDMASSDLLNSDNSHYGNQPPPKEANAFQRSITKVDLGKFLSLNDVTCDYSRGFFLHLVADFLFFTEFFDGEYLKTRNDSEFASDLYVGYIALFDETAKRYNLKSIEQSKHTNKSGIQEILDLRLSMINYNYTPKPIFTLDEICNFIEQISDKKIADYISKYKK